MNILIFVVFFYAKETYKLSCSNSLASQNLNGEFPVSTNVILNWVDVKGVGLYTTLLGTGFLCFDMKN